MGTCACCGYNTLGSKGVFEICPICFWEDDSVQEADPWFESGANQVSLWIAQKNFKKLGAMEERFVSEVRPPSEDDQKNSLWRALTIGDRKYSITPKEIEAAWGTAKSISYNYWERKE